MAKKKAQPKPEAAADTAPLAFAVADHVQIREISLLKCNAWRAPEVGTATQHFLCDIELKFAYNRDAERGLYIFLDFLLKGWNHVDEAGGDHSILLEATFLLVYELDSIEGFEDAHYKAFAEMNGVFQGWPFWREFVLNTTARMGIFPITLPVHRVSTTRKVPVTPQKKLPATK